MESWSLAHVSRVAAIGFIELAQRVLIILCDVSLILYAAISMRSDWWHSCDEALHLYCSVCILLCMLDIVWEFVRCTLESSLDRLQEDAKAQAMASAAGSVNLLANRQDDSPLGSPIDRPVDEHGSAQAGASPVGTLGQGIRREKVSKQRRTRDLHFWSLVFTAFVSITFSLFSSHDEDCAIRVPELYQYINTFTYVFICRLGLILLIVCSRAVKNYEDAALAAGSQRCNGRELVSF
eukprot:TRINITY_DN20302_c0_g1_i2.p1 TRINITY_DN20302_c0_g1~~TRINITY_DN20302_c0_g1_i2.p1  ORF type:complete len:266 (-),score=35.63 TRINITY_DN20302_c0_g1_i2:36-746(-)